MCFYLTAQIADKNFKRSLPQFWSQVFIWECFFERGKNRKGARRRSGSNAQGAALVLGWRRSRVNC